MKSVKKLMMFMGTIFSCACAAGCANGPERPNPNEMVFVNAAPWLGDNISVSGFLKFEFENKNIFPIQAQKSGISRALCLPIFIRNKNKQLELKATKLNGSLVTVDGKIIDIRKLGLMSFSACRPVGIEVTSISSHP